MDIVTLLDVGFEWVGQRVAAVQPEQWELQSPCEQWSVRELLNHMIGVMDTVTGTVEGRDWPAGVDAQTLAQTDRIGGDPAVAFEAIAARALAVWHTPGVLERECPMPGGLMPASAVARVALTDSVVHGWDIARATGQHRDIPAEVAEPLLELSREVVHEGLRGSAFAPEIHMPGGSVSDRLVAFLGRTP